MLLFGVIRRKQQIILSYIQNSKWNSALDGLTGFAPPLRAKKGMIGRQAAASGKNGQNRREADASLLFARVFT
ncbi:hypothetical protein GL264_05505 [Aeromonas jandaei]|uniref:hypothetical protein n=1 Tax=Aeromonas jandaei TaxID=650 RepID=UPI001C5B296F|nr:hypothetical protein [Aeromonas jandaei]MBW3760270.1 hypothetical protein [Aeromonas jandaei]MBW3807436.1 hypothetical protein [Aeromonas jandaei]